MKRFRTLAIVTTVAVYFLIFVGGLVRVSGAGLGCPDWPKCFGRWIPPTHISQLPPNISPSEFNITLAWIEYFNRLVGVSVGILILTMALMALISLRAHKKLLFATLSALVLVAYQGWQGSVVVSSELQPFIVSIHLLLALIIAAVLLYIAHASYVAEQSAQLTKAPPSAARTMTGVLAVAAMLQIVLGAVVRGKIDAAVVQGSHLPAVASVAGIWAVVHMIFGLLLAAFALFAVYFLFASNHQLRRSSRAAATGVLATVALQLTLGLLLTFGGLSSVVQLFHLWLGALLVGFSFLLYQTTGYVRVVDSPKPLLRKTALVTSAAVFLLGFLSVVVIAQANQSREPEILGTVPEFSVLDETGTPVVTDDLRGKITVFDFIYTNCLGACPIMAREMSALYRLYKDNHDIQFISITVDPDNDTPDVLTNYAKGLGITDRRWRFLRTDILTTRNIAEQGFMVSGDLPGMHSTKFVLIDPTLQIRGYYEHSDPDDMKRLRNHIASLARSISD